MENPNNLLKDAFTLLDKAEAIVTRAVSESRAMSNEESDLVAVLKDQAQPMLRRANEMRAALQAGR